MFNTVLQIYLDRLRLQLAHPHTTVLLSLLAVITGLLTGVVIVLFCWLLAFLQTQVVGGNAKENYEALSDMTRLCLPIAGGLSIAACFGLVAARYRQVGVLHVFERLQYHQGRMPWINMLLQFGGALLALVSGFAVGREGPCIHMGGYGGSWVAQRLQLPNNSTRTLVAGGVAAAIGASFSTPLAGIIFAMEVIMQQYTVQGFIPIMLAAVSGTYLSQFLLGKEAFFSVTLDKASTGQDWWLAVLLGVCIGLLSAGFNQLLIRLTRWSAAYPLWQRLLLAGLLMGIIAWWVPACMGVGYDTINAMLNAQVMLDALIVILLAKIVASVVCLGLGVPGGVIGPLMFIGTAAGGVLATLSYYSDSAFLIPAEPKLYPLLGMSAMFSASLQAPLAGLTAVMELSDNADIILPAMLCIVSANLTSSSLSHHHALFASLLRERGLGYDTSAVTQRLRMIGAASIMNRSLAVCAQHLSRHGAIAVLQHDMQWLLIMDSQRQPQALLRSLDVHRYLALQPEMDRLDLLEIPAQRLQVAKVSVRASLYEAQDTFNQTAAEALYLQSEANTQIYGVLTRARVERACR